MAGLGIIRRTLPDGTTEETYSNPADELQSVLQVLAEYVDDTPDDPALYDSVFLTACWQAVELTMALLHEHNRVLQLMDAAVRERQANDAKSKLVVAGPGEAREFIRSLG